MAIILREADVKQVIDMDAVIGAVEAAMHDLGTGEAQNEPRRRAFAPGGLLNVMFAAYPRAGITGLKAYTVAGGQVRFLVTVFKLDGSLDALVEADHLGTFRTGAASAVAARLLTAGGQLKVALIGAGWQARTQALALSRVLDIGELAVFSRDAGKRAAFAEALGADFGIRAVAAPTAETAIRDADIVLAITTSSEPVFEADWVAPHALVIGAGSNFPSRCEIPPELLRRASRVVVDQLGVARLESGDLLRAESEGQFTWDRALELGALLAATPDAASRTGITLFESHGMALWDIAAASTVVPAARAAGLGEESSLLG